MAADVFTKHFPQSKSTTWTQVRKLINVMSPDEFEEHVGEPGGGIRPSAKSKLWLHRQVKGIQVRLK